MFICCNQLWQIYGFKKNTSRCQQIRTNGKVNMVQIVESRKSSLSLRLNLKLIYSKHVAQVGNKSMNLGLINYLKIIICRHYRVMIICYATCYISKHIQNQLFSRTKIHFLMLALKTSYKFTFNRLSMENIDITKENTDC